MGRESQILQSKDYSTIVGDRCKEIIKDIDNFFEVYGDLYNSLGIIHKRGYLLYGPPGTGKTSIIKSIASYKKKDIYKISFKEDKLGDDNYKKLINNVPSDGLILLDDVSPDLLKENGYIEKFFTEKVDDKVVETKKVVSYDTLLNILDGVNSSSGRLVFITTNHPDKLGSAIIRPGRIDVKVKLDYATNNEIKEYFQLFYKYFKLGSEVVEEYANQFIRNIRNHKESGKITFAELQQYLVTYMENIEEAVRNCEKLYKPLDLSICV